VSASICQVRLQRFAAALRQIAQGRIRGRTVSIVTARSAFLALRSCETERAQAMQLVGSALLQGVITERQAEAITGQPISTDPLGPIPEAAGAVFGGLGGIALRVAVGTLGAALLIVGLLIIATDVTVAQAATRLGRELRGTR
jgi:hypothetical protein